MEMNDKAMHRSEKRLKLLKKVGIPEKRCMCKTAPKRSRWCSGSKNCYWCEIDREFGCEEGVLQK